MVDIERLIQKLGRPGAYHVTILILVSIMWISVCHNNVIMAFYGVDPPCLPVPEGEGTVTQHNSTGTNYTECVLEPITSIVTEWNLRGPDRYLVSLTTSIYFAGIMVGGLIMGPLADKLGRKPVMIGSLYLSSILGVVSYFMPSFEGFLVLRFLIGLLLQALSSVAYVMVIEMFVGKYRLLAILMFEVMWAIGVMLLALFAYWLPHWRDLQLFLAIPPAITLVYFWWLPESPRWLNFNGKMEDLSNFFKRAAWFNRLDLSSEIELEFKKAGEESPVNASAKDSESESTGENKKVYFFIHMLQTRELRKRSFILFYGWFLVSMNYYALTIRIGTLGSSRYMKFFLGGLMELVAYCVGVAIMTKLGRKKPFIFYFIAAGVCILLSGIVGSQVPSYAGQEASSILSIVGRLFTANIFQICFAWTAELFPTLLRSTALATCNFWTRAGGLVAPQLLLLGDYTSPVVPLAIMGAMSIVAGLISILLPDTHDNQLPDSFQEAHNMKVTEYLGESPPVSELDQVPTEKEVKVAGA